MRDIDKINSELTREHPELIWEQLRVAHPGADDDGLWFFRHPASEHEVQLESSTGMCPFLFETTANTERVAASTVAEAIALVSHGLGLSSAA